MISSADSGELTLGCGGEIVGIAVATGALVAMAVAAATDVGIGVGVGDGTGVRVAITTGDLVAVAVAVGTEVGLGVAVASGLLVGVTATVLRAVGATVAATLSPSLVVHERIATNSNVAKRNGFTVLLEVRVVLSDPWNIHCRLAARVDRQGVDPGSG